MKDRLKWIDLSKGIGMMLVVIGHTGIYHSFPFFYNWIYSFHMPLFYFISGFLYNSNKYSNNVKRFLQHRWKSLGIPYITLNCAVYILLKTLDIPSINAPHSSTIVIGVLAMYFIRVLLITELWFIFLQVLLRSKTRILIASLVIISVSLFIKSEMHITWGLSIEPLNITMILPSWPLFYFVIGYILKNKIISGSKAISTNLLIILTAATFIISFFQIYLDIANCIYFSGIGIAFIFLLSFLLEKYDTIIGYRNVINDLLIYIGKNTLVIVAFYQIIYNGLKIFTLK